MFGNIRSRFDNYPELKYVRVPVQNQLIAENEHRPAGARSVSFFFCFVSDTKRYPLLERLPLAQKVPDTTADVCDWSRSVRGKIGCFGGHIGGPKGGEIAVAKEGGLIGKNEKRSVLRTSVL